MIYAIIVLYNKKITDSITYNFLSNYKKKIIINIFDNSSNDYLKNNNDYCKKNGINYYTLKKNIGISKAYNYVIDKIDKSDNNYVIILDDDTLLNKDYINEVIEVAKRKKADISLPVVFSNDKIISPANVQFNCRIKILKNIDELDIKRVSAINSAMVVRTSIYKKIHYNENMFLDYVDHDFMKNARNNNCNIVVMKSSINQNYARFQRNELSSEITRFKIYLKDFKIYCSNCHNLLFYHMSVFKYKITECIKYRTLKFLFLK